MLEIAWHRGNWSRSVTAAIEGNRTYEARNVFTLRPDEAIYGLGFNSLDTSNRRGKELLPVQTNVGIVIPVLMSSRRYGVMWDTYSQMRFKDDAEGMISGLVAKAAEACSNPAMPMNTK